MDNIRKEKLNQFGNDIAMNTAVKDLIMSALLKPKGSKDVNFLASERLALDAMEEAWKELDKFKPNTDDTVGSSKQIGL